MAAALILLLAVCPPFAPAQSPSQQQEPSYHSLPGAKALAVDPEQPERARGLAHSQPHDLAASIQALQQCEAAAPPGRSCEIVRLNDEAVTSGREIRSRVPEGAHPLFLWRYQRGSATVFLAGSIHILKPSLYPLPEQLDAAFDQSDYLVLEVDLESAGEQEMQRRTLAHALLPGSQQLSSVLPEPLYRRLGQTLAAYGLTTEAMGRAKPTMVMNELVLSRLMALGYLPDSGLESHFLARRTDQGILALETIEDQLALLFDQPMPTQVQLLAETLDIAPQIEPLLAGLLVAWLAGDDAAFMEMFKAQSGDSPLARAFTRALLDDRNRDMADTISGYLNPAPGAPGKRYFVLVGAAHLVGDQGIVSLLAERGLHGKRISSTDRIRGR